MKNLAVVAAIDFAALFREEQRSLGGTASVIKSILPHLEANNVICLGITSDKAAVGKEIKIKEDVVFIPIIYTPHHSKIPKRLKYFLGARRINIFLRKYDVSSVYSHSFEMSFWIDKNFGVVEHMHGAENAVTKATFSHLRLNFFKAGWEYIRASSLKKAKGVVAIDELCFRLARQFHSSHSILRIPNFVDTDVFFPDPTGFEKLPTNKKIILFVGRIEEVKGLELFIDVVGRLNKTADDWVGVIVGNGSYQSNLEAYSRQVGNAGSITFLGPIYNQSELRKIYSMAQVLLLTSHYEGVPMTVLESLACGTPVISTDVGGISSLGTDSVSCLTINNRNPDTFANAILDLGGHRSLVEAGRFPYGVKASAKNISEALAASAKKKSVFAPIPLPPPVHGSNLMNKAVVCSQILSNEFDFDVFPMSYNTNSKEIGRFQFRKVFQTIKNLLVICTRSFRRYDLVYYSPAVKGFAFYRDLLLLLPLKMSGKNILIHLHGKGIEKAASRNRLEMLLYKLFFRNTSVICLSERLIYDIKSVFSGPLYIVNNGIDEIEYPPRKRMNSIPVILFLSNLIASKGVFVLLSAAKILKNEGLNFKIDLVGAPRGDILARIEEFIKENNLSELIISIGPKYDAQKVDAFINSDIFVFPTEYENETWGLVVNEAMQASLPVIATTEGALPDIIEDGVTGFLIERNTPELLADKIRLLLADENLRIKMGQAGFKRYEKKYTSKVMHNRLKDVFSIVAHR